MSLVHPALIKQPISDNPHNGRLDGFNIAHIQEAFGQDKEKDEEIVCGCAVEGGQRLKGGLLPNLIVESLAYLLVRGQLQQDAEREVEDRRDFPVVRVVEEDDEGQKGVGAASLDDLDHFRHSEVHPGEEQHNLLSNQHVCTAPGYLHYLE